MVSMVTMITMTMFVMMIILIVSECARLPGIPPSPEYIWLSKERQRKRFFLNIGQLSSNDLRAGSCSSLPDWAECWGRSNEDLVSIRVRIRIAGFYRDYLEMLGTTPNLLQ